MVSSLTGYNLEQLQNFLNSIPLRQFNPELEEKQLQQPPEFQVRNIYVVISIPLMSKRNKLNECMCVCRWMRFTQYPT